MWLIIEIGYFIQFLFSLMIFCLLAYCLKFKSIWKDDGDDEDHKNISYSDDIWSNRTTDDFLRYFKREAFLFGFFMTQFLMILDVLFFGN